MLKVLHLERKFTTPTETFIVNQMKAIEKIEHIVFTIRSLNNLYAPAKIYSLNETSFLSTKFLSKKSKLFFQRKFKDFAPSVIHCHYLTDAVFFYPFTKFCNIPKICSCYGYDVSNFPKKYGWFGKEYLKRVFEDYQLFLAMSEDMKQDLLKLGCEESKIKVHYHGINTKLFEVERDYSKTSNLFNLLTIASIYPFKGHIVVLKAIIELLRRRPEIPIKYKIVGDGPEKEKLKAVVLSNKLQKIVTFQESIQHGEEFLNLLKRANVFIHPSVTAEDGTKEGIPGAIVEAMSSGLPVISSYHAGIPSIIKDGSTGLLIKENNYTDLATKLILLYEDDSMRELIGKNAKKYSHENLNMYAKGKKLNEIYESINV